MSPAPTAKLAIAVAALTLPALPSRAADPVTHYTAATINSATSVYFEPSIPDSVTHSTGADAQLSAAGTNPLAYLNGSGGYTVKPTSDDVFALASLSSAQLKARAYLGFGANTSVTGAPMPVGQTNGSSRAYAAFADHFSAYAGTSPFLWTSGDQATFQFAITGTNSSTPGIPVPASSGPGQPKDLVQATLQFSAFAPGGLDLLDQLTNFDFANRPLEEYYAINAQLDAKRIADGSTYWYLGNAIAPYPIDPSHVLTLDPNNPTLASFAFHPSGDFDWLLQLDATIQLDASLQNTSATLDFSHTIATTYVPPPGTTTYSSSGLFPSTLPLAPEPAALGLSLLPLAALARRRRD